MYIYSFLSFGLDDDADLVRRLPIESVGTIVDEVGPCEKMGPLKKIPPASRKNGGPLKNTGGGLKDAVRRYTTPIMGSIYSMVTIEKTQVIVFMQLYYLHSHLAKATSTMAQINIAITSSNIRLHLLFVLFCC